MITEENFTEYFFPAKPNYKPEKGQTLARWRATADFIDGWVKRNVIELLATNKAGAKTALSIMKKLVHAPEKEAIKVLREMAEDLLNFSVKQVAEKPYRFTVEQFYWTRPEYIPDDPHWELIKTNFVEK